MHFRVREKVVQLIRTTYDEATKKPKATIIGRLRRAGPAVDSELEKVLTKEELAEVHKWISGERRLNGLKEEVAALSLPEALFLAEQWFASQKGSDAARMVADQIVSGWQALRSQLRKDNLID